MNQRRFIFISFVLFAGAVFACFNVEFAPRFRPENHPVDMRSFFDGNLGVIQPTFYHFYVFAAYRQITGLGLHEAEKRSLAPGLYQVTVEPNEPQKRYGYDHWLEKVSKPEDRQYTGYFKSIGGAYESFLNCPDDAYETAVTTLEERSRRFGPDSEPVKLWLEGQEQVFSNCGGGSEIPAPLGANVDPLIRADREYQIACAYFYSGDFDEAAKRFEGIGADTGSPWNEWGKYLAARCFIRKGMLAQGPGQFDRKSLEEAALRLEQVLADPRLQKRRAAAQRLLDYVQLRIEPQKRFERAARVVVAQQPGDAIGQAWIDFDYLLDRGFKPETETDLWTWLNAVRGQGSALQTSLERWKATNAPHWLLAAILSVKADDPAAGDLMKAAAQLPESSPAYLTVTYHRLVLALEKGGETGVLGELNRLLGDPKRQMPPDSRDLFLALRFRVASNFTELLKYAPREPLDKDFIGARAGSDKYLDTDSLVIFNSALPLSLLQEAVTREELPVPIRQELALAAWSRAVLVGDGQAALRLGEKVKEYWPDLKGDLARYEKAEDEGTRKFCFALTLLQHPGIQPYLRASLHRQTPIDRIDDLRENWWCSFQEAEPMHEAGYEKRNRIESRRLYPQDTADMHLPSAQKIPTVPFLTTTERQAALSELDRLRQIPAAPDFLCEETLKWARAHRDDPRVPEALHLAVRATRFGCESEKTTDWSRSTFQFLHRNYPSSKWAKATPYWY
jgi:hypothetical protein